MWERTNNITQIKCALELCSGSLKQLCQMRVYEYRDIKYQYRMMSSDYLWHIEVSGENEYCIIFYRYMIWQEISYFDKGCKQLFEMPLLSIWVIQDDIIETLLILCRVFYIRSFSTLLRREKCPDDCACVHLVSRSSPATQKNVNPAKLLLLISA